MKKFLIIGSANAITYKEIFPYIASGEWFIRTANGKISFIMYFTNGDGEVKKVPSVWFTNLDSRHLYKTLELTKTYDPEKYPHYDNYNAIEVGCIKDIPYDYDGVMGVPISIVLFSPYQFEIIKFRKGNDDKDLSVNGKCPYFRILIKKKVDFEIIGEANHGKDSEWDLFTPSVDGKTIFKRILIKRVSK